MGEQKPHAGACTLTLDAWELHDLIEAALVCECQNAQIINRMKRAGQETDAQKLSAQNARLMRVVKRMQEAGKEKNNENESCRAARC